MYGDGSGPEEECYSDGETEDYVFVLEPEMTFDFGDAPDSTNSFSIPMDAYPGVAANFPTVHTGFFPPFPLGPCHNKSEEKYALLGSEISLEPEADRCGEQHKSPSQ
jgi:hypothetical protein